MRRQIPLVLVSSVAFAQLAVAQPKPAARVPTRPVPCAKDDLTLGVSGLDPVVCWDKGCMKLDMTNTDASWIVKPPPAKPWLGPVAEVKEDTVCLGGTCKPLGKKLVAALAERAKTDPKQSDAVLATSDLKAVVIGPALWSVKSDNAIKLTPPALYAKTGEKPTVASIQVAGDLLVVQWTACAGPCTKFALVDSNGINKNQAGEGGGTVFQLDAKRFVVTSEYSTMSMFTLDGKPRGTLSLSREPDFPQAVRIDDDTFAVMSNRSDGMQVVKVSAPDDPKIPARVGESQFLPKCYPTP